MVRVIVHPRRTLVVDVGRQIAEVGEGGSSYRLEFTDASLSVAYLLPVTHSLGRYPTSVSVFDSGGDEIEPDEITNLTTNSLSINLESFVPLEGTWLVTIGA